MAEIVYMPKLSDTMLEGVVAGWNKKVGDTIKEGEILAEIETDKATMEFESFYDGVLLHIGVETGKAAPVNSILAIIGNAGEDVTALLANAGATPITETKAVIEEVSTVVTTEATPASSPVFENKPTTSLSNSNGRVFASPLAKRLAEEKGVDINQVAGTGESGRIVKRDVDHYVPYTPAVGNGQNFSIQTGVESFIDVPNSQMRKAIAKALTTSKFSAPHFYLKMEVDMDNAIAAREVINSKGNVKVSFNDMVIKAVAASLRKHPKVNADWIGEAIRYNNHIHVGVAVAVEDGLVVPVVKFADTKGIAQLGSEIKDLAVRARDKKIKPEEMTGGTFAVSNLGMYGIEDFTSIINPPNGCILSVGQIKQTPVVKNGEIVPGNVMKLSLSCDHRVVDGAIGSEFLQTLKNLLENPVLMLV
ncbi:MAG: pyruvate dehydrogenase complex dihydrolipoamide acetyltransferase [Flavobacteriia bacterium]|nr:pyruvate dehydrogenase complex dihydrolipoamide acetyltransferase [Flavobacteriia bacterium]